MISWLKSIRKLTPNIFYLPPTSATDRPIMALIQGSAGALIVDAGNSPRHAREFLNKIKPYLKSPVQYAAITHWHWDHVLGISVFEFPVISSLETKEKIKEMAVWKWDNQALDQRVQLGVEVPFCRDMIKAELPPAERRVLMITPPQIGFTGKFEVDLGNLHCLIERVGGDHAADSSVIYVPEAKVLFIGDCLNMDIYHGTRSYSTTGVKELVNQLSSYEVNFFVDSHNGVICKEKMRKTLADLLWIAGLVEQYGKNITQIKDDFMRKHHRRIHGRRLEILRGFMAGLEK